MTEVNSTFGALLALIIGAAFMSFALIWSACKSASLSDARMRKVFAGMIQPEDQKIESRFDEVKCRGCGMIVVRSELTALGWCGTCTTMLTTGTHWACRKCGAVVLNNALFKDECWECRQVETSAE